LLYRAALILSCIYVSSKVFMVMKIQVVVWVVTPHSVVVGYQRLWGPCCLHFTLKVAQQSPPKCWYSITLLHSVTTWKTTAWIL